MDSLLQRFRNNQKHSLDFLERIQVAVRQDVAPPDDLVKNLAYALRDLQKAYQEIRTLSGVETDGLSVAEYESAWNEARKNRVTLEAFLRLSCAPNRPEALQALREAQKKAEALLRNPRITVADAALYQEFLDRVQDGQITKDRRDEMERKGFSWTLIAGLLMGCYYISNSSQNALEPELVRASDSMERRTEETVEDSTSIRKAVEPAAIQEPRMEETEEKLPSDSAEGPVEQATEEALNAQNADNLRAIGKVNAKAFISELKKCRLLLRTVMMLVSYVGVMEKTAAAMILQHSFPTVGNPVQSDVSQAIDALCQNGLLAHYILPESGRSVYALSEYAAAVQTKSKVKDYLMKNNPVHVSGRLRGFGKTCGLEKLQAELTISDAVVSYLSWIYRTVSPAEYNRFTTHEAMKWTKEEYMTVNVPVSGEVTRCTLVPAKRPPASMPETAVLLCADEKPDWTDGWTDFRENVFLLQAGALFRWNADAGWDTVPELNRPMREETKEPECAETEDATEAEAKSAEAGDVTEPETKSKETEVTDSPALTETKITSQERNKLETQSVGTDAEKLDSDEASAPNKGSDLEDMPESFIQGVPELAAREMAREILDAINSGERSLDSKIVSLVETLLAQDSEQSLPGNQSKIAQGLMLAAACYHDPAADAASPKRRGCTADFVRRFTCLWMIPHTRKRCWTAIPRAMARRYRPCCWRPRFTLRCSPPLTSSMIFTRFAPRWTT